MGGFFVVSCLVGFVCFSLASFSAEEMKELNCAESRFHTHLPPWKGLQLGVGRCVLPGSQCCSLLMHKTLQDSTAGSHAPGKTGTHGGCWRSCGAVKKGARCLLAQLLRFAAGADVLVVLLLQTRWSRRRRHRRRRRFTVLQLCWEASRLFPALLCRSNLGWYSLERFLLCIDFFKKHFNQGSRFVPDSPRGVCERELCNGDRCNAAE